MQGRLVGRLLPGWVSLCSALLRISWLVEEQRCKIQVSGLIIQYAKLTETRTSPPLRTPAAWRYNEGDAARYPNKGQLGQ